MLPLPTYVLTRSQAVARIADSTASTCDCC